MTTDVNVVLINFPAKGNEMVVPNEDGSYTILINVRLSEEGRMLAYQHAMRHIAADDFQKEEIQTIEAQAHELLDSAKVQKIPSQEYEIIIKKIQQRRKKIKKAMAQAEEKIKFIQKYGQDQFFERAEEYYLYGDNL